MDLASPMETTSINGKKYFLIMIDDYSQGIWVEPIALKMEVFSMVKEFIRKFETGYGAKVHGVMADNGTEYVNFNLQSYFKTHGIAFYSSVPYIHKQNGVVDVQKLISTTNY